VKTRIIEPTIMSIRSKLDLEEGWWWGGALRIKWGLEMMTYRVGNKEESQIVRHLA
jgi:hypothetical protein